MSKSLLTVALLAGALTLVGARAARADSRQWFGPYETKADAEADGDDELDNGGADSYGVEYYADDPTGGDQGEGYYMVVHYADPTPPGPPPPVAGSPPPPAREPDDDRGPYGSFQDAAEAGQSWLDLGFVVAYEVHARDDDPGHWYVRLWNKE
jgi:hypothetical protein